MRSDEAEALLTPQALAGEEPALRRQLDLFENTRDGDLLQQMLYLDSKTYLPSNNLAYSDKTSMAHSVELRVPFLDMEILELVQRVPSRYKANLRESKILLKEVANKTLPRRIVHRRKAGFGLPLKDWFLHDLQPLAQELLSESRLRQQGIFQPELPARWLREHREMAADHCMKLYNLMTFQLWLDAFGVTI